MLPSRVCQRDGLARRPSSSYAVFNCQWDGDPSPNCALADIAPVGSAQAGNGFWGQSGLGGNVWEWNLDWYWGGERLPTDCVDCAYLTPAVYRVARGGGWRLYADLLRVSRRNCLLPNAHYDEYGVRCARSIR